MESGTILGAEVEAPLGIVNLKRGGPAIHEVDANVKKLRDQSDLKDQLLEEPLALVFAHGVAEGDG